MTDADLNANPVAVENATVIVAHDETGEIETVTLTETGANTGVFAATLATAFGAAPGADNDGAMNVVAGDSLTHEHNDAFTAAGGTALRSDSTNIVGGADAVLTATAAIVPGGNVTLSVTDADLNLNAGVAETVAVTVVHNGTGESETVTLTETGINTGVFAATLSTAFGLAAGANNDGTMTAQAGDSLASSYADALTAAGDSAVRTAATAVNGGADGILSATAAIIPGNNISLSVTDADLNANAGTVETISVSVVNGATGETETITLTETGANTGIFAATLATAFGTAAGTNNNGAMIVQAGNSLTSTYADALTAIGGSAVRTAATSVNGGVDGAIAAMASIIPGESVAVSVTDADLNANAGAVETVSATVVNGATGESETILLTETGANTGIFSAALATVFGTSAGADNDGTLIVQANDSLTAGYFDGLTTAGGMVGRTANTAVTGGANGTISATAAIVPGQSATITVTDADLNANAGAADTLSMAVVNTATGESETLLFTETGANTGVFKAVAATVFGTSAGTNNDGVFSVQAANSLLAIYADAFTAAGGTASSSATTTINGGMTAALALSGPIRPDETIAATLTDSDFNANSGAVETVSVSAVNDDTGETETIVFTETGANTGVFAASIATRLGPIAGANGDGIFSVIGGHTITFTVNDPLASNGGPANVAKTASIFDDDNRIAIDSPIGPYNTTTHDVVGTTDPFSFVSMTDPVAGGLLTATADAAGDYVFPAVEFPQGFTAYTVDSVDLAGNPASAAASVTIDSENDLKVTTPPNGSVLTVTTTDISGVTNPNAVVTFIEPATGNLLTATANFAGNFTFSDVALNAGQNNMSFASIDGFGNAATDDHGIFVDPNISLTLTTLHDGDELNYSNPAIAGATDPLSTVVFTHAATGRIFTTTANAAGAYSFGTIPFADGSHTIRISAVDPNGNAASLAIGFLVDTKNVNQIADPGAFTSNNIAISWTTDPFSIVKMAHPLTGQTFTANANAAGKYVFPSIYLPDDDYTFTTVSTDPLGNVAADSANIAVDASIALAVFLPPNRSVVSIGVIDISGQTDPFAAVTMTDPDTGTTRTTTADAAGTFTFANMNLDPGINDFHFVATDVHGNSAEAEHALLYDPNFSLNILSIDEGEILYGPAQEVSGETSPFATVRLAHPLTGEILVTTAGEDGRYVFAGVPYPEGPNAATVFASDALGLGTSATVNFLVRTFGADASIETSAIATFGSPILIEVRDLETYLDPNAIDTLKVVVSNPATGDSETRTLVETAPASGLFRGWMPTVESAVSDGANSGTLAVQYGDVVVTTYVDNIQADGSVNVVHTAETAITNDGLKLTVRAATITGEIETTPLANRDVAVLEFNGNGAFSGSVFNVTTDADGSLPASFLSQMKRGKTYRVVIKVTINGFPYSQSVSFSVADLEALARDERGVRLLTLTLDPAGYVYDATTGSPIAGADVTLLHADGSPAVGPFTLYTQAPSKMQTNPQLSGDSGAAGGFEFIGVGTATDLQPGDYYITVDFDSNPALGEIYAPIGRAAGAWPGIQRPYGGQVFRLDQANQPIGMRIPLFRADLPQPLLLEIVVDRGSVSPGDIVTFAATLRNLGDVATDPSYPIAVRNEMPAGLAFVAGSPTLKDGTPVEIKISSNDDVYFLLDPLEAAGNSKGLDAVTWYFQAAVSSAAAPGALLIDAAVATINQVVVSNRAYVPVIVIDDPLFNQATLLGKVFEDPNGVQDRDEPGVPEAGLVMEDGVYITTDDQGRYSVPGARPGMQLTGLRTVKLDMASLPEGAKLTTPQVQFAVLRPGGLDKANFGVQLLEKKNQSGENQGKEEAASENRTAPALFTGLIDLSIGEILTDSGWQWDSGLDLRGDGATTEGRAAGFYFGKLGDRYKVTAAYDSYKSRDDSLQPDRSRDLYYPTYGDDSSLRYLANSQGRFYLEANSPSSRLLAGAFTAQLADSGLASVRRSLNGALFELSRPATSSSEGRFNQFRLFASKRRQLHARSEIRAFGGTQCQLAHTEIAPGSETVWVEIRDALTPEKVLFSQTLKKNVDYEIDYLSGRIRLLKPVPSSLPGSGLLNDEGLGENGRPWIVAEYLHEPEERELGTFGLRALAWAKGGVGLGVSYLNEDQDGRRHELRAADLHLNRRSEELATLEWARSESGGDPWLASVDGGSTYIELGDRNQEDGTALKGTTKLTLGKNASLENYYYRVDPEFRGGAFRERGMRRVGSTLTVGGERRKWTVDYTRAAALTGATRAAALNAGGGKTRALRVAFERAVGENASLTAEYLRRRNDGAPAGFGLEAGSRDAAALQWKKTLNEKTDFTLRQQAAFGESQEYRTTAGVEYRLRESLAFSAEGAAGTRGRGGRLGFERTTKKGSRAYFFAGRDYSSEIGGMRGVMRGGVSGQVARNSDAYLDREIVSQNGDRIARRIVGLNHKFRTGGKTSMSLSMERSEDRSSLQGGFFTNTATLYAAHSDEASRFRVSTEAEHQSQSGSIARERLGFRSRIEGEPRNGVRLFAEHEYNTTENRNGRFIENKYTKAMLGAAYRPSHNDRLNLLAKAARIHERRTLATDQIFNPDTVSTVRSLESIYDMSRSLQVHAKIATKHILHSVAPLPSARARTTLVIAGAKWRVKNHWDIQAEWRTRRQPTQANFTDGAAAEIGYTIKEKIRLGAGYNFSSYTDDEFQMLNNSYSGFFFRVQAKF